MSEGKAPDPEFLRRVAREMRANHQLRDAMELEGIADEIEAKLRDKPHDR